MVMVNGFYSYLAPVGSFNWGCFDRPRTIMTFDRWMDCAVVIVGNFCGYLATVAGFELIMLHFGRLSFRIRRGEMRCTTQDGFREVRHFGRLKLENSASGALLKIVPRHAKLDNLLVASGVLALFRQLAIDGLPAKYESRTQQVIATKNVVDWLSGDTVINPITRPVSHGMKLQEFILDAGTAISL
ncbi:hypothetical protein JCGZ_17071 [Jatropha curcas]|uniref:Uncharacterized protein n=1 Tax=Jatropha curcas TaxID=180498 RepID=A0A067LE36_JATCU|nr:hypothetical protein JCGZ_17071 [Jatropha curcas]